MVKMLHDTYAHENPAIEPHYLSPSANLARKTTGFSDEDIELLWQAIINIFEHDRSVARGKMAVRNLIVFKHESELGNAAAYTLIALR